MTDLPVMAEGIDDAAHTPAIGFIHRKDRARARGHGLGKERIRVWHSQDHPHSATAQRFRAKVAVLDGDTIVFGRCVFQWMSARSLYDRVLTFAPPP